MAKQTYMLLLCLVTLVLLARPAHAFGAGNIASISAIEGRAFRHGDIEDVLKTVAHLKGHKWTTMMVKRVYFGNWLRDYSQAVDVGTLKGVQSGAIRILVWILAFMSFGYATGEFEVTEERLGCYRPEEHIDNPEDYADNVDARQYDKRLRPPVRPEELAVDPRTGMKNYIANEDGDWATSIGYVKFSLARSIHFGRVFTSGASGTRGNEADLCEALRCLGQGLHCLEDFGAHTNYVELALRELGFQNVFPHTGVATGINLQGKQTFPLVTGTFGGVDFMHSVLGEVTDHVAQSEVQSEVEEMRDALNRACASNQRSGGSAEQQASSFTSLLSQIPGTSSLCREAVQLQRDSDAQAAVNAQQGVTLGQQSTTFPPPPVSGHGAPPEKQYTPYSQPQDASNAPGTAPQYTPYSQSQNFPPPPPLGSSQHYTPYSEPQELPTDTPSAPQQQGSGYAQQQQNFPPPPTSTQPQTFPPPPTSTQLQTFPPPPASGADASLTQQNTGTTQSTFAAPPGSDLKPPAGNEGTTVQVGENKIDLQATVAKIYPILAFRDNVVRAIAGLVEKIPGLEKLIETISEKITLFIMGLLAPYIIPVINVASSNLKLGSSAVVIASAKHQYGPWEDPNCTAPTHSLLSKDHFSNILNEPAGKVAATILQYVAPRVVYAWENPGIPVEQILDDVVRTFHHPALRENIELHQNMFSTVRRWVDGLKDRGASLNDTLSSASVKAGKNHRTTGQQFYVNPAAGPQGSGGLGSSLFGASSSGNSIWGLGSHSKVAGSAFNMITGRRDLDVEGERGFEYGSLGQDEENAPGVRPGFGPGLAHEYPIAGEPGRGIGEQGYGGPSYGEQHAAQYAQQGEYGRPLGGAGYGAEAYPAQQQQPWQGYGQGQYEQGGGYGQVSEDPYGYGQRPYEQGPPY